MTSSSIPRTPRVLIVGKDARTDAIAWACSSSPQRPELFALAEIPIPGLIDRCGGRVRIGSLVDVKNAVNFAREIRPDLVIIGPEEPLAAGVTDALNALGIPVFGPSRQLAAIESSKSWARDLVDRHGIAGNPEYRVFADTRGLRRYMEDLCDFVVKPDGLTAGKGVRVFGEHLRTIDEAFEYAELAITASGRVQVEERLIGEEFSLQTITDGEAVIHCPLVQDHKRAFEGDQGPNTGGMGSYSCADFSLPFLDAKDADDARLINEQVIDALARETGTPYRGVLYGGFMATHDGVKLIEYNSRFGDPEALNVLPLLKADFIEVCAGAARGELERVDIDWEPKATVCKYVVPSAYPNSSPRADQLTVPDDYHRSHDLEWFWAACKQDGESVYLTSSRSGAYVGIGDTLEQAEGVAEGAARRLEVANAGTVRHRADIGRADVINARIEHMRSVRGERAVATPHQ